MEIWHRITYNKLDAVDHLLDRWSIKYKRIPGFEGYYILTFEIAESDRRWPQVANLLREKKTLDLYDTVFTPEEIVAVEWIRLMPVFEQGYPAPEKGWKEVVYADQCPKCGVGYRQKAPFRLAKEPRLGKHSFMSLYWSHTVFTTPQVTEVMALEGIRGYEPWDAFMLRTGQPSQVVSQLFFPVIAESGLAAEDQLQPETCAQCGLTKYGYHKRGNMRLRRNALHTDVDIQLTQEWFGSGGYSGFREILIANRLARLILAHGWRGVSLKPVELI